MTKRCDDTLLRSVAAWGPRNWVMLLDVVIRGRPARSARTRPACCPRCNRRRSSSGREHIPEREAFVLVGNHHQSPGIWIGMVVAAISRAVAEARPPGAGDLHWLALGDWRWVIWRGYGVPHPVTGLLFGRALHAWGAVPTPSDPADVAGRARALRQVLGYLGRRGRTTGRPPQPVAIFPEGTGTIALAEAQPGSGAFLAAPQQPRLPAAAGGPLLAGRGGAPAHSLRPPFHLGEPPPDCALALDDWARQSVMGRVGALLPPRPPGRLRRGRHRGLAGPGRSLSLGSQIGSRWAASRPPAATWPGLTGYFLPRWVRLLSSVASTTIRTIPAISSHCASVQLNPTSSVASPGCRAAPSQTGPPDVRWACCRASRGISPRPRRPARRGNTAATATWLLTYHSTPKRSVKPLPCQMTPPVYSP